MHGPNDIVVSTLARLLLQSAYVGIHETSSPPPAYVATAGYELVDTEIEYVMCVKKGGLNLWQTALGDLYLAEPPKTCRVKAPEICDSILLYAEHCRSIPTWTFGQVAHIKYKGLSMQILL